MSILNPTGFLQLDIFYYLIVLSLGPALLWYLSIFRLRENKLHDAYLYSGVQTLGIVTHRKVTVHRSRGVERTRTYHIRYAYKAPGTDTVYIKDEIAVKQERLRNRFIAVLVLPGRPESGVPTFLISEKRACWWKILIGFIITVLFLVFDVNLFGLLFAYLITGHCTEKNARVYSCAVTLSDFGYATITVLAIGMLGAWMVHRSHLESVPGRVWKQTNSTQRATSSSASSSAPITSSSGNPGRPMASFETLDDRTIPIVEAVAILDDEEDVQGRLNSDGSILTACAYPIARNLEVAPDVQDGRDGDRSSTQKNIPAARAVELV